MSRKAVRTAVLVFLAGGVSATLLGFGLLGPSRPSGDRTAHSGLTAESGGAVGTWADFGELIGLEDVQSKSGFTPHRPNHLLARDELLSEIWYADPGGLPKIAFVYSSGVEVRLAVGDWIRAKYADPNDFFTARAQGFSEEFGVPVDQLLMLVKGTNALSIPSGFAGQSNRGVVDFLTADATLVTVYGNLDLLTLQAIADSVS